MNTGLSVPEVGVELALVAASETNFRLKFFFSYTKKLHHFGCRAQNFSGLFSMFPNFFKIILLSTCHNLRGYQSRTRASHLLPLRQELGNEYPPWPTTTARSVWSSMMRVSGLSLEVHNFCRRFFLFWQAMRHRQTRKKNCEMIHSCLVLPSLCSAIALFIRESSFPDAQSLSIFSSHFLASKRSNHSLKFCNWSSDNCLTAFSRSLTGLLIISPLFTFLTYARRWSIFHSWYSILAYQNLWIYRHTLLFWPGSVRICRRSAGKSNAFSSVKHLHKIVFAGPGAGPAREADELF